MTISLLTKGVIAPTQRTVNIGEIQVSPISITLEDELNITVQIESDLGI